MKFENCVKAATAAHALSFADLEENLARWDQVALAPSFADLTVIVPMPVAQKANGRMVVVPTAHDRKAIVPASALKNAGSKSAVPKANANEKRETARKGMTDVNELRKFVMPNAKTAGQRRKVKTKLQNEKATTSSPSAIGLHTFTVKLISEHKAGVSFLFVAYSGNRRNLDFVDFFESENRVGVFNGKRFVVEECPTHSLLSRRTHNSPHTSLRRFAHAVPFLHSTRFSGQRSRFGGFGVFCARRFCRATAADAAPD